MSLDHLFPSTETRSHSVARDWGVFYSQVALYQDWRKTIRLPSAGSTGDQHRCAGQRTLGAAIARSRRMFDGMMNGGRQHNSQLNILHLLIISGVNLCQLWDITAQWEGVDILMSG